MSNNIYLSQIIEKLISLPNGLGYFVIIGIIGFFALILAFIIQKRFKEIWILNKKKEMKLQLKYLNY